MACVLYTIRFVCEISFLVNFWVKILTSCQDSIACELYTIGFVCKISFLVNFFVLVYNFGYKRINFLLNSLKLLSFMFNYIQLGISTTSFCLNGLRNLVMYHKLLKQLSFIMYYLSYDSLKGIILNLVVESNKKTNGEKHKTGFAFRVED